MNLPLQSVDRQGRDIYLYSLSYKLPDGSTHSAYTYARDDDDAELRSYALIDAHDIEQVVSVEDAPANMRKNER